MFWITMSLRGCRLGWAGEHGIREAIFAPANFVKKWYRDWSVGKVQWWPTPIPPFWCPTHNIAAPQQQTHFCPLYLGALHVTWVRESHRRADWREKLVNMGSLFSCGLIFIGCLGRMAGSCSGKLVLEEWERNWGAIIFLIIFVGAQWAQKE